MDRRNVKICIRIVLDNGCR